VNLKLVQPAAVLENHSCISVSYQYKEEAIFLSLWCSQLSSQQLQLHCWTCLKPTAA